jgi:hypothetical protein
MLNSLLAGKKQQTPIHIIHIAYINDITQINHQCHAINVPFKQTSAAPRVYTQSIDFVNGAWWLFMGTSADTGLGQADVQSFGNGAPPLNYTGPAYDMYYDVDTTNSYIWLPMSPTDLKPGDYYYDDINQVLSICYAYIDPDTNLTVYGLRPFV